MLPSLALGMFELSILSKLVYDCLIIDTCKTVTIPLMSTNASSNFTVIKLLNFSLLLTPFLF